MYALVGIFIKIVNILIQFNEFNSNFNDTSLRTNNIYIYSSN